MEDQAGLNYLGWVMDVFDTARQGVVIWFLSEDGTRHRFTQHFPVTFYATAPPARLLELRRQLLQQPIKLRLYDTQRRDLFVNANIPVMAIEVEQTALQPLLFQRLSHDFPDITFYDADVQLSLRYQAQTGVFPLSYCRVSTDENLVIQSIQALDTPWELDPPPPPLRVLSLEPDVNPAHSEPTELLIRYEKHTGRIPLQPERPFIINISAILQSYDPDILLTNWGDTWLIDHLLKLSKKWKVPVALNRELGRGIARRGEKVYFSYGQVIHRGQQVHLFGRLHIDRCNAMLWGDYGLDGVFELGRVTGLPLQMSARVSPGSGISAMQMTTALHMGVLIPWHKQQAEDPRSALSLFLGDQGGLVYQPTIGLHSHVGEIDFISMYPSVMVHFNISPETVGSRSPQAELIPELGMTIDRTTPGLVPLTLQPLLLKRIAFKEQMLTLPEWDPRKKRYKMCASAHKWLLVTCFGYLGYKNARFGRIEAHQAVTAYGRETLLAAKDVSEGQGFEVLHMYVDGLWVRKPGLKTVQDFQPILDEVALKTGLPIALDGIFRWVAFLPSRRDVRIPVPNRYFGVFQDGTIKIRGIEARRGDTPACISGMQMEMLKLMAKAGSAEELPALLPQIRTLLLKRLSLIQRRTLPLEEYLVTLKLSRTLDEYKAPNTPTAAALTQLEAIGKSLRPGQRIRFLFTLGDPGVHAWDLPDHLDPQRLDVERYKILFMRAAFTLLQPLGFSEIGLEDWLFEWERSQELPMASFRRVSQHLLPAFGFQESG
jgi:DNA polymerase-2